MMSASKTNIRFNYFYRDAGNYKNFGSLIFSNPDSLQIEELNKSIISSLIDGAFFNHNKVGVPDLYFFPENPDDHYWHEYENIEETYDSPTNCRTINDFLVSLGNFKSTPSSIL